MGKKLIPKNAGGSATPNKDKVSKIGEVEVGVKGPSYQELRENMRKPNKEGKVEAPDDLNIPYASKVKLLEAKKRDAAKPVEKKLIAKNKKGGKNWIQGAVNPKHKGYCTPMTKSTCTPRRKAFAMTMKKHHGFHKEDGGLVPMAQQGMAVTPNNGYIRGWFNAQPPRGIPQENTSGYGNKNYYNELRDRTKSQLRGEHFQQGLRKAGDLAEKGALVLGGASVGSLPGMVIGAARALPFTGAFTTAGALGTGSVITPSIKDLFSRQRKQIPQLTYPEAKK